MKRMVGIAITLVLLVGLSSTVKAANVRFAKENGGENIGTMYGVFDTPTNISISEPTKEGYTFAGWATDDENLTISSNKVSVPWSVYDVRYYLRVVDAYATWEAIEYTIDYELDGGEAVNPTSYTIEDEITLNNPTKEGYEFTGWTDEEGNDLGTDVTIQSGSMGEKVFTANWEAIVYNISYDLDGGEAEGNPDTYTVEDTFTLNKPTKEGYTFVGWIDVEGVDVGTEVTVEEGTTGDLIFTAKWEKKEEEKTEVKEEKVEKVEKKVTKNPQTGDGIVSYAMLLVAGVAGLALLIKTRK